MRSMGSEPSGVVPASVKQANPPLHTCGQPPFELDAEHMGSVVSLIMRD